MVENAVVNEERTRDAATIGYLNATELADYLVKKGVPFRTAHEAVGRAVLFAIDEGKELNELSVNELKQFAAEIGDDVADALSLDATLAAKSAIGGTSPVRVIEALKTARTYLS